MDDVRLRMLELSNKGYYCSQILLILGLEVQGKQDPDLIRAMGGLALGAGTGKGTCGALAGAGCLIALHTAKGHDGEEEREELWLMLDELWEWFEGCIGSTYGGIRCDDILKDGVSRKERCGPIVAAAYAKTMDILTEHGFDPTEPRGD